jgi:Domain of unknown function (DUF4190)
MTSSGDDRGAESGRSFELRLVAPPDAETAPPTTTPTALPVPPSYPPPYAPYPPPYGPYPPPPPYAMLPPFNTYAILAAIFAFVVFPPLGIYFGYKAREQIAQTGERGIELAKVGIIGGWIITGLQAAFLVVWCGMFLTFFTAFSQARPTVP